MSSQGAALTSIIYLTNKHFISIKANFSVNFQLTTVQAAIYCNFHLLSAVNCCRNSQLKVNKNGISIRTTKLSWESMGLIQ